MKPLKILHTDFHTGWGGQAARVLMLSRELTRRGHQVTVAAPPGELASRARAAGLPVESGFSFRAPSHVYTFLSDVARMRRLLKRERFDVVDVHGSQDTWVTAVARLFTGLPRCLIMTRHNTKRVRTGWPNRQLYGRLIDHLIIVDESVRRGYEDFLASGILDARRISVIPSAYRADLFHEGVDSRRVRRELGVSEGTLVVGVAGRLVADKGHIHLMRAAAALKTQLPDMVLVFAGAGPEEARLKAQARELGLEGMVRFLGFRQDIAEVEAAFDIAVLPSVGCDASSASVKEAMALGVPIIASDIGGARHLIDDGVTGLIVRPGEPGDLVEAVRRLAEDRLAARGMAMKAREDVTRRFSIGRLADETLAVYATVLHQREPNHAWQAA
ncbi:MAG TPA: glycosyltransferase family 4 protein [Patescibacteria group bacterium]|jgi:glycosyltransferase involved in cell wall biosynthesis|nr:glycosyltransferase family 4 protein [Patescibacteria group bacterium]